MEEKDNFYCISFIKCRTIKETIRNCRGHGEELWNPFMCEYGVCFPVSKFEYEVIKNSWRENGFKKTFNKRIKRIKNEIGVRTVTERERFHEKDRTFL